ncbi:DUF4232 domain-containing protein [Streptomyces sp. NPDC059009]|uniref:DUF4232 domain-containing protein n=1 Tax=Streptomyces sp. NPDC059009 TaxID=3346694 RepID=UPI003674E38D
MTVIPLKHAAVVCGAVILLLTGCGGPSSTPVAEKRETRETPETPETPASPRTFDLDDMDLSASPGPDARPGTTPSPQSVHERACANGQSAVLVEPGPVDAAMGLRAMTVTLTNCATEPYRLNGYPTLKVLGDKREPFHVQALQGTDPITQLDDPGPHPVTLKRGETATTAVVWRNTYDNTAQPPLKGTYLKVVPTPGGVARILAVDGGIDLGSTGRIGATAWKKAADDRRVDHRKG